MVGEVGSSGGAGAVDVGSDGWAVSGRRARHLGTRAFWVAVGIAATMVAMPVTARLDHSLDQIGAAYNAWATLIIVTIPALVLWSDLLYRSVVIVWSAAILIWWAGTFGYFWWPVVMLPFAWIGAAKPSSVSLTKAYTWVGAAVVLGAFTVPVTARVARPAYGPVAVVCLASDAPETAAQATLAALFPSDWNRGSQPGVSGVGTDRLQGRHVVIVEFDSAASESDRQRVRDAARSLPQVVAVIDRDESPQRGGSRANPCP